MHWWVDLIVMGLEYTVIMGFILGITSGLKHLKPKK